MNYLFNTTAANGLSMGMPYGMYGGNFLDILFRHLMERGWEGLTLMAFVNFYMYLSLDRIKDMFKYINDKFAERSKMILENYGNLAIERTKVYFSEIVDKLKHIKFRKKQPIESDRIESTLNTATITLSSENKVDLMALGNFLLKIKAHIELYNYHRKESNNYKATESYILPDCMKINHAILKSNNLTPQYLNEDIIIEIDQNVDYTLICESDSKLEILKDVKVKLSEKKEKMISWNEFADITKKNIHCLVGTFTKIKILGWSMAPDQLCGGACTGLIFYIYYTKNFDLFKLFISFLAGKGSFDFSGKKYILSIVYGWEALCDNYNMKQILPGLEKYCDETLIPESKSEAVDKWIKEKALLFDTVNRNAPSIKISFQSEMTDSYDLFSYSRYFMNSLVSDYYHQSVDNIGNKISVYQLFIKYDIEMKKKENPEYEKWEEKYGKKEEDDQKVENKDNADEDQSNGMPNPNLQHQMSNIPAPSLNRAIYGMPHYSGYHYTPPRPDRFIEEQILIPIAESQHIRSDRKPMQHLYLQKAQKELLESYLCNFKNNQELYEKFGIIYKGGILLSGVPGCGKTSTIMAIATYLNKNIYYLDLGQIKTNHELKLCIDFVKTGSQKGGVIIFEDIDCMTNVVHCRNLEANILHVNKINSLDDKLSLSFFLNVLDGTLSPENIIFVMTTNHKEVLDPALIRPGRMDISIDIIECDRYQLEQIYYDLYNRRLGKEILDRFKEYEFITSSVIMHLFHNVYNKHLSDEELLKRFIR